VNVSKIGSGVVVVIARLDCAVQWNQEPFVLDLPYWYSLVYLWKIPRAGIEINVTSLKFAETMQKTQEEYGHT